MKLVKVLLGALVLLFIGIQLLPDRLPENKPADEKNITHSGVLPDDVLTVLKASCFDCHSSQTQYPWYAKVAPTSWLLANHISDGRDNLNFSEWENYSKREKISKLEDIQEQVTKGEMPLKSYIMIHRKARLSPEEISLLAKWTEETTAKILE